MNTLTLTCETPDELIAGFGAGARIRLDSSATEAGVYANVTYVTLVAATRAYTYEHLAGTSSTWYKVRFEDSTGANANDYGDPFQVAPEGSGLICSLWDVKQRLNVGVNGTADTSDDEFLLELIRQVTTEINGFTGRQFTRNPASGTSTWYFDVATGGRTLRVPKGIASATTLEVATSSQPESGGTFTTVTAAEWFLRPVTAERDFGWPATSIVISDLSSSYFSAGYNTVRLVGALGWSAVPPDVAGIAETSVVRRFQARQSGQADIIGNTEFGGRILRMLSPEEAERLTWYRHLPVA